MLPFDDQQLLEHTSFLRRLAIGLVREDAAADDVVQEAMLTAITRPPVNRGNLRGWLATVTRNLSLKWLRDQRAQKDEAARYMTEGGRGSTAPLEDRRAALDGMADALRSLGDPYLEVVMLRYFEGLTPTAIATRLDVPLATVSSRLQRALKKLRARMEERRGADWRAGLVGLVGTEAVRSTPPTTLAPVLGIGFLTMTKKSLLLALAVTACISVVGLRLLRAPVDSLDDPRSEDKVDRVSLAETSSVTTPEPTSTRASARANAEPKMTSIEEQSGVLGGVGTLDLALVWLGDGTPAAAVRVGVRPSGGIRTLYGLSDERGNLSFEGLPVGKARVLVHPAEHDVEVQAGREGALELAVEPRTDTQGTVLDAAGKPIMDAQIVMYGGASVGARTDANGRFRARSVRSLQGLAARAEGYVASEVIGLVSDAEAEVTIVLRKGGSSLRGVVRAPDGRLAPGIALFVGSVDLGVSVRPDGSEFTRSDRVRALTDARGCFVVHGLRMGSVPIQVPPVEGSFAEWTGKVEVGVADDVEIALGRAVEVTGTVHGPTGAPVELARVSARWGPDPFQALRTVTSMDGSFRLAGVPPGAVTLTASRTSLGSSEAHVDLSSGETYDWTATLRRVGESGSLVDSDGRAVSGASMLLRAKGFEVRVSTDSDGRFLVPGCPERIEHVTAITGPEQRVLGTWSNLSVPDGDLNLRMEPDAGGTARIAVRILGPGGAPAEDARLRIGDPGRPFRIGTGPVDENGDIRVGPLNGSRLQISVSSATFGRVGLGIRVPDDEGLIDLGTVHLLAPGALRVLAQDEAQLARVESFTILTESGQRLYEGAGVPSVDLRIAAGDYSLKLTGSEMTPSSDAFTIQPNETSDLRVTVLPE